MTGGGGTSGKCVKGSGVRPWVSARSWAQDVWPGLGLQAVFSGTSRARDPCCPLGRCRAQAEGHTGLSVSDLQPAVLMGEARPPSHPVSAAGGNALGLSFVL